MCHFCSDCYERSLNAKSLKKEEEEGEDREIALIHKKVTNTLLLFDETFRGVKVFASLGSLGDDEFLEECKTRIKEFQMVLKKVAELKPLMEQFQTASPSDKRVWNNLFLVWSEFNKDEVLKAITFSDKFGKEVVDEEHRREADENKFEVIELGNTLIPRGGGVLIATCKNIDPSLQVFVNNIRTTPVMKKNILYIQVPKKTGPSDSISVEFITNNTNIRIDNKLFYDNSTTPRTSSRTPTPSVMIFKPAEKATTSGSWLKRGLKKGLLKLQHKTKAVLHASPSGSEGEHIAYNEQKTHSPSEELPVHHTTNPFDDGSKNESDVPDEERPTIQQNTVVTPLNPFDDEKVTTIVTDDTHTKEKPSSGADGISSSSAEDYEGSDSDDGDAVIVFSKKRPDVEAEPTTKTNDNEASPDGQPARQTVTAPHPNAFPKIRTGAELQVVDTSGWNTLDDMGFELIDIDSMGVKLEILSFSPSAFSTKGGRMSIKGCNFGKSPIVSIRNKTIPKRHIVPVSDELIIVDVPAMPAGPASVSVENEFGQRDSIADGLRIFNELTDR